MENRKAEVEQIKKEAEVAAVQGINPKLNATIANSKVDAMGIDQLNTQHIIAQASAKTESTKSTNDAQQSTQAKNKSSTTTEANPSSERNKIAAGWPKGQTPSQKKPGRKPTKPTSQPTSRPSSYPSSQPTSQPTALGGVIHGEITIKPELLSKIKTNSIMFVIVRRYAPKGQKGMMIAAIKVENIRADRFPLRYAVTPKDAMMGAPLAGKVQVSARIDQDGDAISKQPGDLIGSAEKAVMVGVNPVKFTIDSSI